MLDITANSTSFQGGEGQSVFPIPFPFLETAHIRARVTDANGAKRALAPGVDYSVNRIADAGGELILLGGALPPGSVLSICRLVPLTQEILFHNQGPNSPRAMEEAADKLTMIAQQLQSGIDNCLSLPGGSPADATAATIAESAEQIGRVRGDLASLSAKVDACAPRDHSHGIAAVAGLSAALAAKLDADDPRLGETAAAPTDHAATHARGGGDPLRPEDIGALAAPPADGKPYLAAAGGWIEYVAPSGGGENGGEGAGTPDHSQLVNRDAADQHPQSAIRNLGRDLDGIRAALAGLEEKDAALTLTLAGKADAAALPAAATAAADGLLAAADKRTLDAVPATLSLIETRLLGHDGRLDTLDTRTSALPARLTTAEGGIAALTGRLNAPGAMASAADAPQNGKPHARQDGGWVEMAASGGGGSGGGAIVGEIRLLPFRATALPAGWYFCNGDKYSLATAQGDALNSLPAQLKSDWGISAASGSISLPNLFDAAGNGYFPRPVNGGNRTPGNKQDDAIRNIQGSLAVSPLSGLIWINSPAGKSVLTGAFKTAAGSKNISFNSQTHGANTTSDFYFDASGSVPVSTENRPYNVGMTPAIYLGV